jgi:hypothetical protein
VLQLQELTGTNTLSPPQAWPVARKTVPSWLSYLPVGLIPSITETRSD